MLFLKLRYSYNEIVKIQNFLHLTFQTQYLEELSLLIKSLISKYLNLKPILYTSIYIYSMSHAECDKCLKKLCCNFNQQLFEVFLQWEKVRYTETEQCWCKLLINGGGVGGGSLGGVLYRLQSYDLSHLEKHDLDTSHFVQLSMTYLYIWWCYSTNYLS